VQSFIIGDIHGCYDEFRDLLDKAGLTEGDAIIAIGDIVDRGPDTPRVVEFFQTTPNACSILGNHERKHIRAAQGELKPALSQFISRTQLGEAYDEAVAFMQTFPLYLNLPEALLVHGFWEPGIPLEAQKENVLAGVMSGETHLRENYSWPWYHHYDGEKPLVVGHRHYLHSGEALVVNDRVYALDTGCVRGGRLTGLLIPSFKIVSVPSRENYWSRISRAFIDTYPLSNQQRTLYRKEVE
jgi:serine/threonine protein phosphatase 1